MIRVKNNDPKNSTCLNDIFPLGIKYASKNKRAEPWKREAIITKIKNLEKFLSMQKFRLYNVIEIAIACLIPLKLKYKYKFE